MLWSTALGGGRRSWGTDRLPGGGHGCRDRRDVLFGGSDGWRDGRDGLFGGNSGWRDGLVMLGGSALSLQDTPR